MPRLPHSLLLRAYKISPLLPLVLRGTRTLESAINELRWLREHVEASKPPSPQASRKRLLHLCKRRSRAEPLQYILGSQPFGPLDIKCRPGVLIPRPETEAYTSHLADLLISGQLDEYLSINATETRPGRILPRRKQLSILDVCSGSGCISLLLHSLLLKSGKFPNLRTLGLDISPQAAALANENLARNTRNGHFPISKPRNEIDASELKEGLENACSHPKPKCENPSAVNLPSFPPGEAIHFAQHDIFADLQPPIDHFSIIICNPPYISTSAFARETTRSVRLYEPKLALVPDPEKYASSKKKKEKKKKTPSTAAESEPNLPIQSSSSSSKTHKPAEEINPADIFYHQLLHIYTLTSAHLLLLEVSDAPQALRVLHSFLSAPSISITKPIKFEIWRDFPGQEVQEGEETSFDVDGVLVPVKGAGSVRAVVLFRGPEALGGEEKMGCGE